MRGRRRSPSSPRTRPAIAPASTCATRGHRVERQDRTRGADRSRDLTHPVGDRLPPAADLLPRSWSSRWHRRTSPSRAFPSRSAGAGSGRRLAVARESVRGTPKYGGRRANLLLANWDWKQSNNKIYQLDKPVNGVTRWFMVRDLGASLGKFTYPTFLRIFGLRGFGQARGTICLGSNSRASSSASTKARCTSIMWDLSDVIRPSTRPSCGGRANGCRRSPTSGRRRVPERPIHRRANPPLHA